MPFVESYRKLDPDSEEARKIRLLLSVNIGDPEALNKIVGPQAKKEEKEEYETPGKVKDPIDAFLDKFGVKPYDQKGNSYKISEITEEEPIELLTNPEWELILEPEEERGAKNLGELIKERKYLEDIQLIEAQNLNNPQKSIYFAHQMRLIKKLIRIEKYRNQTKGWYFSPQQ